MLINERYKLIAEYLKEKGSAKVGELAEKLFVSPATVSHAKAIEKAKAEYKKYQAKTLSPVEKEYLQTIKCLEKQVKSKAKRDQ